MVQTNRMSSFIQKTNPFSPRNSDISIETSTPPVSRSITPDDVTPVQITRKISINIPDDQTKQLHHNIDCVIEEEQELEEDNSEGSKRNANGTHSTGAIIANSKLRTS